MPAFLLNPLFLKVAGGIGAALALLLAIHLLLSHEQAVGAAKMQAQWAAANAKQQAQLAALQADLNDGLAKLNAATAAALAAQVAKGQAINLNITKDTADAPRYTSPDCTLTDRVQNDLNAARQLSHP